MKAQIVSFHCVLKDKMGRMISSTYNQDVITQLDAPGQLLEGLARGLENLREGEKRRICLAAGEAYGFYDPRLVIEIARCEIDHRGELRIGQQVQAEDEAGDIKDFRVVKAAGQRVTLDGNHPLAGQDLVFEIEATAARDASRDEITESGFQQPGTYLH